MRPVHKFFAFVLITGTAALPAHAQTAVAPPAVQAFLANLERQTSIKPAYEGLTDDGSGNVTITNLTLAQPATADAPGLNVKMGEVSFSGITEGAGRSMRWRSELQQHLPRGERPGRLQRLHPAGGCGRLVHPRAGRKSHSRGSASRHLLLRPEDEQRPDQPVSLGPDHLGRRCREHLERRSGDGCRQLQHEGQQHRHPGIGGGADGPGRHAEAARLYQPQPRLCHHGRHEA